MTTLALDIGGANLKAVCGDTVVHEPFELWKAPHELAARLKALPVPAYDRVAMTMTGELCDCFATLREGVQHLVAATLSLGKPLHIWATHGRFVEAGAVEAGAIEPLRVAAGNWHALATWVARSVVGSALLIDIGSTTTDRIPLRDGKVAARGLTDTQRLRMGELVYVGVKRTPLMVLTSGVSVMNELFATTADLFDLSPEADTRIARMVGGDRETLSPAEIQALRKRFLDALLERIDAPADQRVIVSGAGEFLLPQAEKLSQRIGVEASRAACAFALRELADG